MKCKNGNCEREYDPQETKRVCGDVSWLYDFCSAGCFTQSIMKKGTRRFELYDPMENEVIAGYVETTNRGDAAMELLSIVGYEVREIKGDETDGQG